MKFNDVFADDRLPAHHGGFESPLLRRPQNRCLQQSAGFRFVFHQVRRCYVSRVVNP